MPRCAAFGCKSGYDSEKKSDLNISLDSFPLNDSDRLKRWLQRLKRGPEFKPKKGTQLCSLHFSEDSFKQEKMDKKKVRIVRSPALKLRVLKNDAVPTTFPNCPSSMSYPEPEKKIGRLLPCPRQGKNERWNEWPRSQSK